MTAVINPIPYFTDLDGDPLDQGFIYLGVEAMDARTNPIQVYWDANLTIPAVQPIRTVNGYPLYQGRPSPFFVAVGAASVTVLQSNGVAVINNAEFFDDAADLRADLAAPSGSSLVGFIQAGTGAVLRTAQDKMRDIKAIADFAGADPTGATNSAAALANADAVGDVFVTNGTFLIGTNMTLTRPPVFSGGILKIASGVTLTLPGVLAATQQIFDVSLGGTVVFDPPVPDCYPEWFGTDDQVSITAALATGSPVTLGRRTYNVTGIVMSSSRAILRGQGKGHTTLNCTSTTADALLITGEEYLVHDMTIDRSVTPTAGYGVYVADVIYGKLENLDVNNHYTGGLYLGATALSYMTNVRSQSNYGHGFRFNATAGYPAAQWYMFSCTSQFNNGHGYSFVCAVLDTTGPVMHNCGSYANSGGGFVWGGSVGSSWNDIIADTCYSSFDGGSGWNFQNLGRNNQISKSFFEFAGVNPTGRGQATPASNVGAGFEIGGTCRVDSSLSLSIICQGNSYQGLGVFTNDLDRLIIDRCFFQDNGKAGGGNRQGIAISDLTNTATILITATVSGNTGAFTSQTYGLETNTVAVANRTFVTCCDLSRNSTGAVNPAAANFNNGAGLIACRT